MRIRSITRFAPLEKMRRFLKWSPQARVKIVLILCGFFFAARAFAGFSTVVIDAGHGGHDRGGIPGQRVAEKVIALDIAQRLRACLQNAGLHTVMTRSFDIFIPLPIRVFIANTQRNAVFVSIHTNSALREGAHGFETYYYQSSAAKLAFRIQDHLLRVTPTENRGVKRRAYYVLRKTRIPAVLAECGFLTNHTEARLALSPAYRQRVAQAIARALIECSGR